jgi:hypothetical protein
MRSAVRSKTKSMRPPRHAPAGVQCRSGLRSEWWVGGNEKKCIRSCRPHGAEPLTAVVCAALMMAGAWRHPFADRFDDWRQTNRTESSSGNTVVVKIDLRAARYGRDRYAGHLEIQSGATAGASPTGGRIFRAADAVTNTRPPSCNWLAGNTGALRFGVTFDHAGNGLPSSIRCSSCGRSPLFHRFARCTTR